MVASASGARRRSSRTQTSGTKCLLLPTVANHAGVWFAAEPLNTVSQHDRTLVRSLADGQVRIGVRSRLLRRSCSRSPTQCPDTSQRVLGRQRWGAFVKRRRRTTQFRARCTGRPRTNRRAHEMMAVLLTTPRRALHRVGEGRGSHWRNTRSRIRIWRSFTRITLATLMT